jgi:hypothetical protein
MIAVVQSLHARRMGASKQDGRGAAEGLAVVGDVTETTPDEFRYLRFTTKK